MKIHVSEMEAVLNTLFLKYDFTPEKAAFLAKIFSESTLDGVSSHGINRVPLFIEYIKEGVIQTAAEAGRVEAFGSVERYDGNSGPGIINAVICTDRAAALAKENGIGCVALRNTNHWMRGGTYGWRAAEAGCISIMFTNTQPNMPAWGGKQSKLGNNPFIVSVPRKEGHVVLDMAITQFAYGKINDYKMNNTPLPFPGGWNENNELTTNPADIMKSMRGLPIGYWKGSALSMVLDVLATLLSAGNSTSRIGNKEYETGISQVFICIDPAVFGDGNLQAKLLDEIIDYTHDSEPLQKGDRTYYPGERTLLTRAKNLKEGITVNNEIWEQVTNLVKS